METSEAPALRIYRRDDQLVLLVPRAERDELTAALREIGETPTTIVRENSVIEQVVPLLVGLRALSGVASVIKAYGHRNDGKRLLVKTADREVDLRGYSADEIETVLRAVAEAAE
ncbi:hypothetical protein IC607_02515 [Cellulomonas sp. JH27-2]|uniref:hypothetical protein n=1 Tax=Cellulomonas sp. JH27-2 TaxID=2774139 RepID=UPI00177F6B2D|nr:hypothetical protein [Cellulomonas sp. JH27-2]MBD8057839.1 hypothetical protein [Cellulomonas sp. JH27-2]